MRYWLGVVSKNHVLKGVEKGFAQVCHGKKAPLEKLKSEDGFIYYSPKIAMGSPEPCKYFTAIGKIKNGNIYQVEMTPDFHPFRIDIEYYPCKETSIIPLMNQLELTAKKSWGMQLLRGLLEISKGDFFTIAEAMGVDHV